MAEVKNTIETKVVLDVSQTQQEIVKLNAVATDSTKTLEERIKAKNKAVELSTSLNQQNIKTLEDEVKRLQETGAKTSDVEKAQKKLDAARLKATKDTANNEKVQNKMNAAMTASKSATANLDKATGGLISKLSLLAANPIVAIIGLLIGAFKLIKESIGRTEDSAADFNSIMAALGQIMTNIFEWIADFVEPVLKRVAEFFQKDLGPVFEKFGGFVEAAKLSLKGFMDAVVLLLTPLRALWATAQAAALAIKGDFQGAKQVFKDLTESVVDTAVSMVDNMVASGKKVIETVKDIGDAYENASSSADNLIARAARIEQMQNQLNKDKRAQELLDAKLGVRSKTALADAKNMELSWKNRKKALEEFTKIELEREERAGKIIEREIQLQEMRMSLGRNTQQDEETLNKLLIEREKHRERLADAELSYQRRNKEFYNLQRKEEQNILKATTERFAIEMELRIRNGEDQIKLQKELLAKQKELALWDEELTQEEKQKIYADFAEKEYQLNESYRQREFNAQAEMDSLDIERRKLKGELTLKAELELLNKRKEEELRNSELTNSERLAIEERYGLEEVKLKKATSDQLKDIANSTVDVLQSGLSTLWGDNKNFARAMAYLDMMQGVAKGVALGFPAAIPAIASALTIGGQTLQKINTSKGPSGTTDTGGGSVTMPSMPAVTNIASIADIPQEVSSQQLTTTSTQTAASNVAAATNPQIVFSEKKYTDFKKQVNFKEERTGF